MQQSDQNSISNGDLSLKQIQEEREKLTQRQNRRAIAAIGGFVAMIVGMIAQSFELLGLGAVAVFISCYLLFGVGTKRVKKLREQEAAKYKQEAQQTKQCWEQGKWEFPCKEFYNVCLEKGVQNLESTFYLQKAMVIARSYVPSEYHHIYISEVLVSNYFSKGKALEEAAEAVREAESRKPRKGKLSADEYQYVRLSRTLLPLSGIDKRISMINDAIQQINKKIYDYEEGQKAIKELGFILSSSVKQEKTKDWAFLGGIADGIAGPGAGIAVAANAIADNIEIEKRNAQARQAANQTVRSLYADAANLSADISDLENERKLMQYHLQDAGTKVVMDGYKTEGIFEKLKITAEVKKHKDGKGLEVTVTIKNNLKVDVPENVLVAVDGTLSAKVFFEDALVDTMCVPLPLFGVSEQESVTAYTDYYVEAEGSYTVEFSPNNLWVVEV